MSAFRLSVKARDDLKQIARYTQKQWGRLQRNRYLKQLDDAFFALAASPALGKPCDDLRPGYRKFPQGSHVIFYRSGTEAAIDIIRILHKGMDESLNL